MEKVKGALIKYPLDAAVTVAEDDAIGLNSSTGYARPLVAGDAFLGLAHDGVDNSAGVAGAKTVEVELEAIGRVPVTGTTAGTDAGSNVYASAKATYTLTSTSNSLVGKVARHLSGTECFVAMRGVQLP